jgi:hypothetical protein
MLDLPENEVGVEAFAVVGKSNAVGVVSSIQVLAEVVATLEDVLVFPAVLAVLGAVLPDFRVVLALVADLVHHAQIRVVGKDRVPTGIEAQLAKLSRLEVEKDERAFEVLLFRAFFFHRLFYVSQLEEIVVEVPVFHRKGRLFGCRTGERLHVAIHLVVGAALFHDQMTLPTHKFTTFVSSLVSVPVDPGEAAGTAVDTLADGVQELPLAIHQARRSLLVLLVA